MDLCSSQWYLVKRGNGRKLKYRIIYLNTFTVRMVKYWTDCLENSWVSTLEGIQAQFHKPWATCFSWANFQQRARPPDFQTSAILTSWLEAPSTSFDMSWHLFQWQFLPCSGVTAGKAIMSFINPLSFVLVGSVSHSTVASHGYLHLTKWQKSSEQKQLS